MKYEIIGRSLYPLSDVLEISEFPLTDLISWDAIANVMDSLYYTDAESYFIDDTFYLHIWLATERELALFPPGLPGIGLFASAGGNGWILLQTELRIGIEPEATVLDVPLLLRIDRSIFQPMANRTEIDDEKQGVQIELGEITFKAGPDGILLDLDISFSIPLCMIGNTGVLIEAEGVTLHLDEQHPAVGRSKDWRGIHVKHASLYLPGELGKIVGPLKLINGYIGNGGFSGTVSKIWTPVLTAQIFDVYISLEHIGLTFVQNTLAESEIRGTILMPFFDKPVNIEIGIDLDGMLTIGLTVSNGLQTLILDEILEFKIKTLNFEFEESFFKARLSGTLYPKFANFNWPAFEIDALTIDSNGNVHLDGGWLDLPEQYSLNFHGFQMQITKLGFGKTEDGGKWLGFSGELKLVEGLTAGASVEGLRITWYEDGRKRITLNGLGIEFEVPSVLRFKGAVSYRELPDGGHRFDGAIKLVLTALNLELDGKLVIGRRPDYTFFAIYLNTELPAGIPLWATGIALYGMGGLFARHMEPDKKDDESWYGIGPGEGWYKRPEIGVVDLNHKWTDHAGSMALGLGVTLGTLVDNGYLLAARTLLVIVFPGPILLIEGKANILKKRASLSGEEPNFRTLAVLDARAGTFLFGLDAMYRFGAKGQLIDIHAGAEAFFSTTDASAWHLYIGEKEPRDRRIRAEIFFRIFRANSYFMLDAHGLALGSWVGYEFKGKYGPVRVVAEAWFENNAAISWKPAHFYGDASLHGKILVAIWKFELGLSIDANLGIDVFDPFHLLAHLQVGINLPWPLPDFTVGITLEWGPEPVRPPLPLPLKEIAIEHLKVTTSWPLPRNRFLLPSFDNGEGFLTGRKDGELQGVLAETASPPSGLPVVPIDCRPHITFGRPVHDDAFVGGNLHPPNPESERIGDPAKDEGPVSIRYGLKEVALDQWIPHRGVWMPIGRAAGPNGTTDDGEEVPRLYGSWAPVPNSSEDGFDQVKLWLWTKTPFEYTRHTGRHWDEWFTDRFGEDYACIPPAADRLVCCHFDSYLPNHPLSLPWTCPEHAEITLSPNGVEVFRIQSLDEAIEEHRQGLCFDDNGILQIDFTSPAKQVELLVTTNEVAPVRECLDFRSARAGTGPNPRIENGVQFKVFESGLHPASTTRLQSYRTVGVGLNVQAKVDIGFPCPTPFVELTLTVQARVVIEVFDENGRNVGKEDKNRDSGPLQRFRFAGENIIRLEITAPQQEIALHTLCFACPVLPRISAVGRDVNGRETAPVFPRGNLILIETPNITQVLVDGGKGACLVQICATFDPDPAELALREEMAEHRMNEIASLAGEGEVLEPWRTYRLKILTSVGAVGEKELAGYSENLVIPEYAYFQTGGPPGFAQLSIPEGVSNIEEVALRNQDGKIITVNSVGQKGSIEGLEELEESGHQGERLIFQSDLDTLAPYVRQTIPATVPAPGEQPKLPRPVYRSYDVGVEFDEESKYVNVMYRLAKRDLGLYLYDSNNQPMRDAQGRLIVLNNRWAESENVVLSESEVRWVALLNASACAPEHLPEIAAQKSLFSLGEGQVLRADTVYEGRLIPLLLHEDFTDYPPGTVVLGAAGLPDGWQVRDDGTQFGPSHWEIQRHEPLVGTAATIVSQQAGTTVLGFGQANPPDFSTISKDFDFIVLGNDQVRPGQSYQIVEIDNTNKQITVLGEPRFSGSESSWRIPAVSALIQRSNVGDGEFQDLAVERTGTVFFRANQPHLHATHPEQPSEWTNYRYTVIVRSNSDGAAGVIFRYQDAGNYYRFSFERAGRYRRLVRVTNRNTVVILAEDDFVFEVDRDYVLTIEAIQSSLRVYQDGQLVFNVQDEKWEKGTIGLYCWQSPNVRFSDVRVDDFRPDAPIVYRFSFTTSRFTNLYHQLHSFQDEVWPLTLESQSQRDMFTQLSASAVFPESRPPSDQESRGYQTLVESLLGPQAYQNPAEVQVTRLLESSQNHSQGAMAQDRTMAFLVQSPEPIDWTRTRLEVFKTEKGALPPAYPGLLKLTDVTFANTHPNEESVSLLLREETNLSGHRIEFQQMAGPLEEPTEPSVLFSDSFEGGESGLLFREAFAPHALGQYTISSLNGQGDAPKWEIQNGSTPFITQSSSTATVAVLNSIPWNNTRIQATLRAADVGTVGLVFRYQDTENFYSFYLSFGLLGPSSRVSKIGLKKRIKGEEGDLIIDRPLTLNLNTDYRIRIDTFEDLILVFLNDEFLFTGESFELERGQVGLYSANTSAAYFSALQINSLEQHPILWQPTLETLDDFEIRDDPEAIDGPSQWEVIDSALVQRSNIHVERDSPDRPGRGTFVLGGNPDWEDVEISVRLRSDLEGSLGIMFRVTPQDNPDDSADPYNYFRFSIFFSADGQNSYARLIKKLNDKITGPRQKTGGFKVGESYQVTVRVEGHKISIFMNGILVFDPYEDLHDLTHGSPLGLFGRIGLYSRQNAGARFEQLIVINRLRYMRNWIVRDLPKAPQSEWRVAHGSMVRQAVTRGPTIALVYGQRFRDFRLTTTLLADYEDEVVGVVFHYVDDQEYYRLEFDGKQKKRRLLRIKDTQSRILKEEEGGFQAGVPFTTTVDAVGSRLVIYLGDARLFVVEGQPHDLMGQVGVFSEGSHGARCQAFEVSRLPLEAFVLYRDRFAGNDHLEWDIIDEGTAGHSHWTISSAAFHQDGDIHSPPLDRDSYEKKGTMAVVGEVSWPNYLFTCRLGATHSGAIGLVFCYADSDNYYRFSMDQQLGYRRLVKNVNGQFSLLWEDRIPYDADRTYEITIVVEDIAILGYLDGVPMFSVQDRDGALLAGRIGLYCWRNAGAYFSQVLVYLIEKAFKNFLFHETFLVSTPEKWPVTDEGNHLAFSRWEVQNGEMRQSGTHPSTYVASGNSEWTDYRLSVRLHSGNVNPIGAMIRYANENNFYRFTLNQRGQPARLLKHVEGVETVLGEIDVSYYEEDEEYILTLDCIGPRLMGYLNGTQIFNVVDSEENVVAGKIGLYCSNNSDANFSEVRVWPQVWVPYYSFNQEDRLPSGTHIKVLAGNKFELYPDEDSGIVKRFVAALGDSGRVRLSIDGVNMRLIQPDGKPGHTKRFLPDRAYEQISNVRILRKGDGTGFFLFPPQSNANSIFESGTYRLHFNFRRDNREFDPESQKLSQAGFSGIEAVNLHLS